MPHHLWQKYVRVPWPLSWSPQRCPCRGKPNKRRPTTAARALCRRNAPPAEGHLSATARNRAQSGTAASHMTGGSVIGARPYKNILTALAGKKLVDARRACTAGRMKRRPPATPGMTVGLLQVGRRVGTGTKPHRSLLPSPVRNRIAFFEVPPSGVACQAALSTPRRGVTLHLGTLVFYGSPRTSPPSVASSRGRSAQCARWPTGAARLRSPCIERTFCWPKVPRQLTRRRQ